jgi:hypothetical protein
MENIMAKKALTVSKTKRSLPKPVDRPSQGLEGQRLISEMVAAGATKTAIATAVGVSDMTILSVSKGSTAKFRKLPTLRSVYEQWKSGTLDLSGNRGKRAVVALTAVESHAGKKVFESPVAEETPADKVSVGARKTTVKKSKVVKKPAVTEKAKSFGRTPKEPAVAVQTGFQIPNVTEEMIAGVEEQIRRLQAQAKYMKDLIALRKKYGQ